MGGAPCERFAVLAIHVGVSKGRRHAFTQIVAFWLKIGTKLTFWLSLPPGAKSVIGGDAVFCHLTHPPENIHRKVIPAIFTL